jgi:hypothetical protein
VSHTWTDACVFPEVFAPNYLPEGELRNFSTNYINDYDEATSSYHFLGPENRPFVPFLFSRYVLEKIQQFCNCQIEGDFMTNTELQKILIVNNYSINDIFLVGAGPNLRPYIGMGRTRIDFISHVPDMSIRAFIAQLADILNYSIDYDEVGNKIIFVKKDDVFEVGNYQDFSKQFIEHTSGEIVNTNQSYQISFSDDVFPEHPAFGTDVNVSKIEIAASTLETNFGSQRTVSVTNSAIASRYISDQAANFNLTNIEATGENNLRFVFWHGLQPNTNGSAPQTTHFTPLLAPEFILNPTDLYNNQFIKFIKAKEETKKYNSEFLFSVTDILNFNINKPIRVNSVTFVPTEASINVTLQGVEPVQITQFRI